MDVFGSTPAMYFKSEICLDMLNYFNNNLRISNQFTPMNNNSVFIVVCFGIHWVLSEL